MCVLPVMMKNANEYGLKSVYLLWYVWIVAVASMAVVELSRLETWWHRKQMQSLEWHWSLSEPKGFPCWSSWKLGGKMKKQTKIRWNIFRFPFRFQRYRGYARTVKNDRNEWFACRTVKPDCNRFQKQFQSYKIDQCKPNQLKRKSCEDHLRTRVKISLCEFAVFGVCTQMTINK